MKIELLAGKTEEHIVTLPDGTRLHRDVASPFQKLQSAAQSAGIQIRAASSFRGYEHQLKIWNEKAIGLRPIRNNEGTVLDPKQLTPKETLFAILRFSAIPGTSRHHWGTDLDVLDEASIPDGYKLQLTPAEYGQTGPFAKLSRWLHEHANEHGFFQPYTEDHGGVHPEPWHLSYRPIAQKFQTALTQQLLEAIIQDPRLELREILKENIEAIFARFLSIDTPSQNTPNRKR